MTENYGLIVDVIVGDSTRYSTAVGDVAELLVVFHDLVVVLLCFRIGISDDNY